MNSKLVKEKRTLKNMLDQRVKKLQRIPAVMGDGSGNLHTDKPGYIWVRINGRPYQALCEKVSPAYNKNVIVGISTDEGRARTYQVLAAAASELSNPNNNAFGYAPSSYYEYMAENGGQDALKVHLRAITYLKCGMVKTGGMEVALNPGLIDGGPRYIRIPYQTINLTAQLPSSTGMAAFVLIWMDALGVVQQTKGGEVSISVLDESHIPSRPVNAKFVTCAVRVYNGQTDVLEGRVQTDFVDLRWTNYGGGTGGADWIMVTEDLTAQIDGITDHFDLTITALNIPAVYCNVRQRPDAFTMDADMGGFTLSYIPTAYDHLIVDYYVARENILFDNSGSVLIDNNNEYIFNA